MKYLNFKKNMGSTLRNLMALGFILVLTLFMPTTASAQDAKIDKATANFCNKLDGLITAVNELDQVNETGTDKEFDKAYNKAVKSWNKFVKSVDKLENVEYKESIKAYNDLVDAVNLIGDDNMDDKTSKKINNHIDSAADTILSLQTMHCN